MMKRCQIKILFCVLLFLYIPPQHPLQMIERMGYEQFLLYLLIQNEPEIQSLIASYGMNSLTRRDRPALFSLESMVSSWNLQIDEDLIPPFFEAKKTFEKLISLSNPIRLAVEESIEEGLPERYILQGQQLTPLRQYLEDVWAISHIGASVDETPEGDCEIDVIVVLEDLNICIMLLEFPFNLESWTNHPPFWRSLDPRILVTRHERWYDKNLMCPLELKSRSTHMEPHISEGHKLDMDLSVPQSRIQEEKEFLDQESPLSLEAQNEAANAVFAQTNAPSEAIAGLVADILDRSKDPAWRDYCLQFLGTALERDDLSDSDIRLARATLDATIANTNGTFAGTALRSLRRAAVVHSNDELATHVSSNALRIARDTAYFPESRTTALLVLEESAHPDTLATARTILSDSTAAPLLRKTAEAVVKRLETVSQPSLSAIESATMSPE